MANSQQLNNKQQAYIVIGQQLNKIFTLCNSTSTTKSHEAGNTMTTSTTSNTAVNQFHKIAALVISINRCAKVAEQVETADLTIAESLGTVATSAGFADQREVAVLFHPEMLSEADARDLDRQLVRTVQQMMAEKIEDAVAQLSNLGVELDGSLTEKYTVAPEDQL